MIVNPRYLYPNVLYSRQNEMVHILNQMERIKVFQLSLKEYSKVILASHEASLQIKAVDEKEGKKPTWHQYLEQQIEVFSMKMARRLSNERWIERKTKEYRDTQDKNIIQL